jgi:hypothetical protein
MEVTRSRHMNAVTGTISSQIQLSRAAGVSHAGVALISLFLNESMHKQY